MYWALCLRRLQIVDVVGDDGKMGRELSNIAEVFDVAASVVVCCPIGMGDPEIAKSLV